MAGWGTGSFENEDAQAWIGQMASLTVDDLKPVLSRAADNTDYLEVRESSIAVAAAEAVATLKGAPGPAAPKEIHDWASTKEGLVPDLAEIAIRAVQRVRTNSELKDLWLQAEGLNEWSAGLRDLEQRLSD